MEYRVESLGFLYLGTSDAPGNQGLYDQLLAIEWIHKNIKNFGGDPQRITLFGESAGAVSVGLHLLSPKSRPYFNNAILESSGPSAKWAVLSPQIAKYRSEKFLENFSLYIIKRYELGPTDPEYAYIPRECQKRMITTEEKFQCIKNYPILSQNHFRSSWALESYNGGPVGYTFVPTIDGDFIPYDPEQMLIKGDFKKCPLLLGVNKDEGSYFIIYVPHGNMSIDSWASVDYKTFKNAMKEYFRYLPTYPTERAPMLLESILQTYTRWHDYNNTVQNAIQLSFAVGKILICFFLYIYLFFLSTGDYHFACPTVFLADIYAQENVPLYFYHFTLRSSTTPWHEWMGTLHGNKIFL
jgi:acetylcholinesterase